MFRLLVLLVFVLLAHNAYPQGSEIDNLLKSIDHGGRKAAKGDSLKETRRSQLQLHRRWPLGGTRSVLVRKDRCGHRLEQRQEAGHARGHRPDRDPKPLVGQPRRDPAQGPQAGVSLEQHTRPHAGSVGGSGEQACRRGRRHLQGRGRAFATAAPPGTDDPARVRPDLDLDQRRGTLAVGHVGLAATGAHPRVLRRIAPFGLLPQRRPPGAAMSGGAGLLAAPPLRTGLLLLLRSGSRTAPSTAPPGSPEAWQPSPPAFCCARTAPGWSSPGCAASPWPQAAEEGWRVGSPATASRPRPGSAPRAGRSCGAPATRSCRPGRSMPATCRGVGMPRRTAARRSA